MIELKEIRSIPTLMRWCEEVIRNVFGQEPDKRLFAENQRYYTQHIADGTHLAFVASVDGEEAGCGAVCQTDELPSPDNPSGRYAYLMNIYVSEAFRNHGVAHHVVSRLIEEAQRLGCNKIYLETTDEGKPVYSSLGFRDFSNCCERKSFLR